MQTSVHYASPIMNPHSSLVLSAVALWLWPVLVTSLVAAFRWRRLRSRIGFLALGYLCCVGIEAFSAKIGGYVFWVHTMPATPQEQYVVAMINESIGATVVGVCLSMGPVIWLSKLLER
jgi:hypothetical protein